MTQSDNEIPEGTSNLMDPSIPVTRALNRPYFLLRAPDRINNYWTKNIYRVITAVQEPLSRFLASGELIEKGRDRSIRYELSAYTWENLRPMEHLPLTEIKAFEEAVRHFYQKAHAETPKITDHEKELRKNFKLPDPDREPDAYWLYGPVYAPKLLILWGCEKFEFSSIPLAHDDALSIPATATVAEKLRERLTPWSAMQRDTFERLMAMEEPLANFLVRPNFDDEGAIESVENKFEKISIDRLRKMSRPFPNQVKAFQIAAEKFYNKAHPNNKELDPVEKEYRIRFLLPDPDEQPDSYLTFGPRLKPRLLIVVQDSDREEKCLHLTDDTQLNIPPSPEKKVVGATPENTVSRKLEKRRIPVVKIGLIGGIAAALLISLGLYAFNVFSDKTPPELLAENPVTSVNDPTVVMVHFNERIARKSIQGPDSFLIKGGLVAVKEAILNPDDQSQVILTTSALKEEDKYVLNISGVTDRAGNPIAENTSTPFRFQDTLPPEVSGISATGGNNRQVVIFFNESLNRQSANMESNYKVSGNYPLKASFLVEDNSVVLEMPSDFEDGSEYFLEIDNLSDTAEPPNEMAPYAEQFRYIDSLAPEIRIIIANEKQTMVRVQFNEPVAILADPPTGSFRIAGIAVYEAELLGNGQTLLLRTQPMKKGIGYSLEAMRIEDKSSPANRISQEAPVSKEFFYTGLIDLDPPNIERVITRTEGQITLVFNEELGNTAKDVSLYKLQSLKENRGIQVSKAELRLDSLDEWREVILTIGENLEETHSYRVGVKSIEDSIGNTADRYFDFEKTGVSFGGIQLGIAYLRRSGDGRSLYVTFTYDVESANAQRIDNYDLTDDVAVTKATLQETDRSIVVLSLGKALDPGKSYQLRTNNLLILDGAELGPQYPSATIPSLP